jgi:hypothetical protein
MTAIAVLALLAGPAMAQGVNDPPGKPSGPQGPGQHGSPGPNGNSGPLIDTPPQLPSGFVLITHTGDHESPTDDDRGGGNDPNGKAPGQTQNPNPSK